MERKIKIGDRITAGDSNDYGVVTQFINDKQVLVEFYGYDTFRMVIDIDKIKIEGENK